MWGQVRCDVCVYAVLCRGRGPHMRACLLPRHCLPLLGPPAIHRRVLPPRPLACVAAADVFMRLMCSCLPARLPALQRWRTAARAVPVTSFPACCSRATVWSRPAGGRCGTAPRAGSAWRRPSGCGARCAACAVRSLRASSLELRQLRSSACNKRVQGRSREALRSSGARGRPPLSCLWLLHLGLPCAPCNCLQPPAPAQPSVACTLQALQHVMEGCGEAFRPYLDDSLRQLVYRALAHPNRFIRCVRARARCMGWRVLGSKKPLLASCRPARRPVPRRPCSPACLPPGAPAPCPASAAMQRGLPLHHG